ncbi:hypothetical protein ACOJQI_16260 [Bacillus salacetis]|uniref:hypothetical protein n=1 Tax=Bacillus salacetis TaxID=2315464 RepID=UPI003BA34E41
MSPLISIIAIIIIYRISMTLSNFLNSQFFYISIPYIGSLLGILLSTFVLPIELPDMMSRIFLTIFLFSIGYQTVPYLKKRFFIRMIWLIFVTALLMAGFEWISRFIPGEGGELLGSIFFAYNENVLEMFVPSERLTYFQYWGHLQLLIVFFITPLFLYFFERVYRLSKKEVSQKESILTFRAKDKGTLMIIIGLWLVALTVITLSSFLKTENFFIYDFVLGMISGMLFRLYQQRLNKPPAKKTLELVGMIGTLHLYIFIISTIITSSHFVSLFTGTYFDLNVFVLFLLKTIFLMMGMLLVLPKLIRKWSGSEKMVAAVAIWTFSLNAPVVCMHGMRTAMNKWGSAPHVLFIIPPVILWLVNYVHAALLLILQR